MEIFLNGLLYQMCAGTFFVAGPVVTSGFNAPSPTQAQPKDGQVPNLPLTVDPLLGSTVIDVNEKIIIHLVLSSVNFM